MRQSLLLAALFAVALVACDKKEEPAIALPSPATAPALPPAAGNVAAEPAKPLEGATLNAMPEQKPAAESKPAY